MRISINPHILTHAWTYAVRYVLTGQFQIAA